MVNGVDIRIGKIVDVEQLEKAKYVTHKLLIDFGSEIGKKTSCASLANYSSALLMNKLIIAVVNLPPKQIGESTSEVLILGTPDSKNACILISPDSDGAIPGAKVY